VIAKHFTAEYAEIAEKLIAGEAFFLNTELLHARSFGALERVSG
jgi:hypothetical protein